MANKIKSKSGLSQATIKYLFKRRKRKAHTAKFERCVMEVKKKSKGMYNPWAVCTVSLKGNVFKRKLKKVV